MNDETLEMEGVFDETLVEDDTEADIAIDVESDFEKESIESAEDEIKENFEQERAELKRQLDDLRAELERHRAEDNRFLSELDEFASIYGKDAFDKIPESVWKSRESGVPLAAAYALYEKKQALHTELAESVNKKNAAMSAGSVKSATDDMYYSPSEVRAMSPAEVKRNYNLIIESMKKWN